MPAVSKAAPERGTGTDTFSPRRKLKAAPRSCGSLSYSDRRIHSQDRKAFHRTDRIPVRHESLPLPVSVHTWLHIPPPSDRGGQNPLYFNSDEFYQSTYQAGQYQGKQYALPYEVNPTLMFVNKTLLQQEGISLPKDNWSLEEFYNVCRQLTKDSNNDGIIDQYGCYNYEWINAIYASGIELFNETGTTCDFNNHEVKSAIQFIEKLNALNRGFNITSNDFDQGKVAFAPMQFSQYRTYKPYPYRVSKYSTFEWDVIEMPQSSEQHLTQLSSLMMGMSMRTSAPELAWQLLKEFTYSQASQQDIYEYSQGVSPLKEVTESKQVLKLLEEDTLGDSKIDMRVLSQVMEYPTTNTRFRKYEAAMKIADNQINQALQNNLDLDTSLTALQKEITNYLNE